MNGLMLRRQAMMAGKAAEPTPAEPLYTLTNGSRKILSSGEASANTGDMKVTDGNHFYFYKRYGGNYNLVCGELTVNGCPFALSAGDAVKTVVKFDMTKTTGAAVYIRAGADKVTLANDTTIFSVATPTAEVEYTTAISTDMAQGEFDLLIQPGANTSGKTWEGDIEIYVNGTRYI